MIFRIAPKCTDGVFLKICETKINKNYNGIVGNSETCQRFDISSANRWQSIQSNSNHVYIL